MWPSSNEKYWHNKISRNVERDEANKRLLTGKGWRVLVIWECQLKKAVAEENLNRLYHNIIQK